MKPRTVFYIICVVLLAVLALANWRLVTQPVELNLLVTNAVVPVGIPLLAIVAVVIGLDALMHAMSRREWMRERHNSLHNAEHHIAPVDDTRIRTLQESFDREIPAIRSQLERLTAEITVLRNLQSTATAGRADGAEPEPIGRTKH